MAISTGPGLAGEVGADLKIDDGVLTFIQSSPRNPITLQDLARHFGPPEYFEAILAEGDAGPGYGVNVYYPSKGLAFLVEVSENDVGYIMPDMRVGNVQYFAPGSVLSYFTAWYSCSMSQADAVTNAQRQIATFVQPWSGFGKILVIQTR